MTAAQDVAAGDRTLYLLIRLKEAVIDHPDIVVIVVVVVVG